jgi:2-polyprenyl-3-methyl-5-hydroxy-6-metoxy-1,4-benzoquinol methylase
VRLPASAEILDVGCGDGLFFSRLRAFGSVRGIETDVSLVRADNPDRAFIYSQPLGDPQYEGWRFDLITALDVIEHIADDRHAVATMISMLKPGGYLLLTVPAFMALWDEHDEVNQHFRRYTAETLAPLVTASATILELRYLFHTIFLPKYLVRTFNRTGSRKVKQDAIPPQPLNRMLSGYCYWENLLLESSRLPFGTSLMALVRRVDRLPISGAVGA